ncbi:unnamed protein product [Plutella xylostella]|uniref:(diamondback moth) hypothetical protein n=1 Tax=Plutella xylostella TaxID=51655 RepID=A0A8S4G0V4_PLUXY|nr:unnamed protein product [Plutella xylostella]
MSARLVPTRQAVPHMPAILKAQPYRDLSGLFTTSDVDSVQVKGEFTGKNKGKKKVKAEGFKPDTVYELNDEDELLYGGDQTPASMATIMLQEQSKNPGVPRRVSRWWRKYLQDVKPTYWLFVVRDNGNLEIYSLPEMRLSFLVQGVCEGHRILADSLESVSVTPDQSEEPLNTSTNQSSGAESLQELLVVALGNKGARPLLLLRTQNQLLIYQEPLNQSTNQGLGAESLQELLVVALGNKGARPLLLLRTQNQLLIYQAYKYPRGNLKLRFCRLQIPFAHGYAGLEPDKDPNYEHWLLKDNVRQLRYFAAVSGYQGVLICGRTPYLLLLGGRGEPRLHPLQAPALAAAAAFNNVNCAHGLMYFDTQCGMCVCPPYLLLLGGRGEPRLHPLQAPALAAAAAFNNVNWGRGEPRLHPLQAPALAAAAAFNNVNWGRGEPRLQPLQAPALAAAAAFNNVNCAHGLMYFDTQFILLQLEAGPPSNSRGRGEPRLHPLQAPALAAAAAFIMSTSELHICVLPSHLSYDSAWPVRKVPIRMSPHFVTYHVESKTYCLVGSHSQPQTSYYKFNGEDKENTQENKGDRFPYPHQAQFSVCLFSPVSWEMIPNSRVELEPWEHVACLSNCALEYQGTSPLSLVSCSMIPNSRVELEPWEHAACLSNCALEYQGTSRVELEPWEHAACLSNCALEYQGTRSGLRGYIVLGTNYNYSEDITSRGRIIIYDIIDVVPEPGQPLTKNKFKEIYAKEQKGPVTALSQVLGLLVSAIGQKIYIWQLKDKDLVGVAFIDTQIYVHRMMSVNNLILVADVYKSISLLRYQEAHRTLALVARDLHTCNVSIHMSQASVADVYKSISLLRYQEAHRTLALVARDLHTCNIYDMEFMVDNTTLGFLASESEGNLVLFMYQPQARESYGGQRLIRKADFHLGQQVHAMFRINARGSAQHRRHVTMYTTLDGGIGYVLPVTEKMYRRLLMLQNVMTNYCRHHAGLNPRAFRTYKTARKPLGGGAARGILDGDLVSLYQTMPSPDQREIAKKIGTKVEEIQADLYEVDRLTAHF